ncbi:hypothetical protein [Frankia sp. Cas3]|uniref:hypothetical protein n=1 Tax=Frankia sp. Cas3 TaxID=3073926 RepID=UPI002AD409C6|nr:hypothetical protein [Frankia sp. Cas3]
MPILHDRVGIKLRGGSDVVIPAQGREFPSGNGSDQFAVYVGLGLGGRREPHPVAR